MLSQKPLLVLLGLLGLGWACYNPKYAKYASLKHVMCETPPSNCSSRDVKARGLEKHDKQAILYIVNKFRSLVANGNTATHHPAENMQRLVWDDELATLAQARVDLCSAVENYDATVDRFKVFSSRRSKQEETYDATHFTRTEVLDILKEVYKLSFGRFYPARHISSYNSSYKEGKGADFTQLIWARTTHIGCGYVMFVSPKKKLVRVLGCNFGPRGNVDNEPVYQIGEPDCEYESKVFPGLCVPEGSDDEPLDCSDNTLKQQYGLLCGQESALHNWIGYGVPFPHVYCWERWWRRMARKALTFFFVNFIVVVVWLSYLREWLCFPIKIFLV